MNISINGLNLITTYEGFSPKPYLDVVKVPSIGYGTTKYKNGNSVKITDQPITKENALDELKFHVEEMCIPFIKKYVTVDLNQNQIDALCSFIYNVGSGNFIKSTLLKKINQKDFTGAAEEFLKWNKAGGKVYDGLTKRRNSEKTLFLK